MSLLLERRMTESIKINELNLKEITFCGPTKKKVGNYKYKEIKIKYKDEDLIIRTPRVFTYGVQVSNSGEFESYSLPLVFRILWNEDRLNRDEQQGFLDLFRKLIKKCKKFVDDDIKCIYENEGKDPTIYVKVTKYGPNVGCGFWLENKKVDLKRVTNLRSLVKVALKVDSLIIGERGTSLKLIARQAGFVKTKGEAKYISDDESEAEGGESDSDESEAED